MQVAIDALLSNLAGRFEVQAASGSWAPFARRLEAHGPRLLQLLGEIYGDRPDFARHAEAILETAARAWLERPEDLRALDEAREAEPLWFESQRQLGGACYVDLLASDLGGIRERIPYFKELGLSYLHLMPLFRCPEERSDGGYAVSSYRELEPRLGTMQELRHLGAELRREGISLCLDFVFNHTSDEHDWARAALAGDPDKQAFYRMFPDRAMPDAYERTLREIFPDEHPGAFTWRGEISRWVWTTFHSFQWDLNYANPEVFRAMAEEMLFLANSGVEVLRLDAVAFVWKELGTSCENLPQAHLLVQAMNALAQIAAPALVFKSEAIVHPDEIERYVRPWECALSYNPLLMALLWNSLATRKVRLLRQAMATRFRLYPGCAWVNYVRGHDDIGWTFSDEDAAGLGVHASDHRRFLNEFYTGRFPGSFARGLPFQENPRTGDCRISGTCASLAGLEQAKEARDAAEIELAIRRILLLHAVVLSIGGVPLLYLGDEIGTLNDYSYRDDPARAPDSRWAHRPRMDWARAERRHDPASVEGRLFQGLRHLVGLRKETLAFAGSEMEVVDVGGDHVFAFRRRHQGEEVLVLANFDERAVETGPLPGVCAARDLVSGENVLPGRGLRIPAYGCLWLRGIDG